GRCGDAIAHDALDQRAADKSWHEPSIDLDICSSVSEFVYSSLRISRDCSVACADLWLDFVVFRMGTGRNFSFGSASVCCDRVFRKNHSRHIAFWRNAEGPVDGIRTEGICLSDALGRLPTTDTRQLPELAWALARPDSCRGVSRCSSSSASLSRTALNR